MVGYILSNHSKKSDSMLYLIMTKSLIINTTNYPCLDKIFVQNSNVDVFIIYPGIYNITANLVISQNNIQLIGFSGISGDVTIIQKTPGDDGLVINADYVSIRNLTLNTTTGGISLTVRGANWTTVENCSFYGSNNNFCIFYSGPLGIQNGQSTIHAYQNDLLNTQNIFKNNFIYTTYTGDSVAFTLQLNGSYTGNIIRGGKTSIYMCKKCNINGNIIRDSTSNGIFVSLPSYSLTISNNIITNTLYSAIVVRNELEQGIYNSNQHNITISYNIIDLTQYYGIEINNLDASFIVNNTIKNILRYGIYCLANTKTNISSNTICNASMGIYMDINSVNDNITNNSIISVYPKITQNAIYLNEISSSNIKNNLFYGFFSSVPINNISNKSSANNNVIANNSSLLYNDID